MQGISSKALAFGEPKNKEKTFQGQRFDYEIGLNWVQFKWRNHDPQTGRFIEIDPLSDDYEYNSTYAFSENKVTTHVELEGLEAEWFERQVERDLRDISSGKINNEQLQERVDARNGIGSAMFSKVIVPLAATALGVSEIVGAIRIIKELKNLSSEEAKTIGQNTKQRNAPEQKGIPNSSKIEAKDASGKTTKYSTYDKNGNFEKQVEVDRGSTRHGIEGATKKTPTQNKLPDGSVKPGKLKLEKATPIETPPGKIKIKI